MVVGCFVYLIGLEKSNYQNLSRGERYGVGRLKDEI